MSQIQCRVSEAPILPQEVVKFASERQHGAQNFFFGAVREVNLGQKVTAVAYDAFVPLAERILREICLEAQTRWGKDLEFILLHRTGRLGVGEISVAIGVTARHRDEAYQASRYVIEELKVRAPIWKKEFYESGETQWLKGHALCGHSASSRPPSHPVDFGRA